MRRTRTVEDEEDEGGEEENRGWEGLGGWEREF